MRRSSSKARVAVSAFPRFRYLLSSVVVVEVARDFTTTLCFARGNLARARVFTVNITIERRCSCAELESSLARDRAKFSISIHFRSKRRAPRAEVVHFLFHSHSHFRARSLPFLCSRSPRRNFVVVVVGFYLSSFALGFLAVAGWGFLHYPGTRSLSLTSGNFGAGQGSLETLETVPSDESGFVDRCRRACVNIVCIVCFLFFFCALGGSRGRTPGVLGAQVTDLF